MRSSSHCERYWELYHYYRAGKLWLFVLKILTEIETQHLVYDYTSFTTLVSKTLKHCLAASGQMMWDHIYPGYVVDQEDYSTSYIKKIETTEMEWAFQTLRTGDITKNSMGLLTVNNFQIAEHIMMQPENNSSSNSDSSSSKKQRYTRPPSPSLFIKWWY